jgi:hypothetical protein
MSTKILIVCVSVFLSTFFLAYGQGQNLILTREQNNKWLDSLSSFTFDLQLMKIVDRLVTDTNVFVRQFYNHRIKVEEQVGNRVYGDGKPALIIGGYPMIIDNKTAPQKIVDLAKLLNSGFIEKISILSPNDPATTAVYGSSGMSGIIVMELTKSRYLKKFKKLRL